MDAQTMQQKDGGSNTQTNEQINGQTNGQPENILQVHLEHKNQYYIYHKVVQLTFHDI